MPKGGANAGVSGHLGSLHRGDAIGEFSVVVLLDSISTAAQRVSRRTSSESALLSGEVL